MADWKTFGFGVAVGLAGAGALTFKLFRRGGGGGQSWWLGKSFYAKNPLSLYVNSQNTENEVLGRLRALSVKHTFGIYTTGSDVGKLLTALTRSLGAKKAIDVGVFTGCSSFAMALALPDGGKVVACDISNEYAAIGRPYWVEGGVEDKIDLRLGLATDTLQGLLDGGEGGSFDLVFIDADNGNYPIYYELGLQLLRRGGLIVVDNALWRGFLVDPSVHDEETEGIRVLNSRMKSDPRVDYVLLTVSDGVAIACKH